MNRITTSHITEMKICNLQVALRMSTKAAVMRLAIGFSLRVSEDPRNSIKDEENENNGAAYLINTITGEYEEIYRMLLIKHINKNLNDNQFTNLLKAHVVRGINYLADEYKLSGSGDRVISKILELL